MKSEKAVDSQSSHAAIAESSSSSDLRRAIVEALAENRQSLTLAELLDRLQSKGSSGRVSNLEEDIQNLLNWRLIESSDDSRRFSLTEDGHRFLSGVRALSSG